MNPLSKLQNPQLLQTAQIKKPSASKTHFAVHNPATDAVIAQVPNAKPQDALAAIASANSAWGPWRTQPARVRGDILRRWFDLLLAHQDDLARIMTAENGKPLAEALAEVHYAASFVQWYAEEAKRVYGEVLTASARSQRMLVFKQPIGVCAAITPWNFPLAMITRKVAPALAAGCPVVLKPAELTPLSALAAAQLAYQAGVPREVLHIITSTDAKGVGQALCASETVRHLSFTGSTAVGRILMAQCAPTVKKLALELGGNAPFIVFDDADLDSAVKGAMTAKFRNAGQACNAANRFYAQAGIYDAFTARLSAEVAKLQVGDGFAQGVQIGPLIEAAAIKKIKAHVQDAKKLGAQVATGGKALADLGPNFYQPTVLTNVTSEMLCTREETFGPLAPVVRFETEAEAIALANNTEFGLAAYFFSRDISRVWRVAEAIESGMVGVNGGTLSNEHTPFGGIKQSGLGREGGHYGLAEYLEEKLVALGDL